MRVLADEMRVSELIDGLAEAIQADMAGSHGVPWAVVGVRSRGDVLANRLAKRLHPDHLGTLDITLYRDDLSQVTEQPVVRTTEIPFGIEGLNVVLVDDVLMTGRSVRAALASLMDIGRPKRVWLSVLVDRGLRELPIAPDHVGLDLSGSARGRSRNGAEVGRGGGAVEDAVAPDELVVVQLKPTDERDAVVVIPAAEKQAFKKAEAGA